jgi:hypothetical protein
MGVLPISGGRDNPYKLKITRLVHMAAYLSTDIGQLSTKSLSAQPFNLTLTP